MMRLKGKGNSVIGIVCLVLGVVVFLGSLVYIPRGMRQVIPEYPMAEPMVQDGVTPYGDGYICKSYNDINFIIVKSYQSITDMWYYDILIIRKDKTRVGFYNGLMHDLIDYCNPPEIDDV